MRLRTLLVIAVLAAVVIIAINLFSSFMPFGLGGYSYAQFLGWGALCASAFLVIQGFWKTWMDRRYMSQLRANVVGQESSRDVS